MKNILEVTTFGELVEGDLIVLDGMHKNVRHIKSDNRGNVRFMAVSVDKEPGTNTIESWVFGNVNSKAYRVTEQRISYGMAFIFGGGISLCLYCLIIWGLREIFN